MGEWRDEWTEEWLTDLLIEIANNGEGIKQE